MASTKTQTFKFLWLQEQIMKIRKVYSEEQISNEKLLNFLLQKYETRKKPIGRFYNNTDFANQIMTLEQFINYFLNSDNILSGYNVLYKNQDEALNIGALVLENLLNSRKFYKNKMEASEWGSNDYVYFKILQLTYKILANSYYGILGEKNSIFYNPFIQNSITMTGQDIITTSIISMEAFLANNCKFTDTDDAMTFISNIRRGYFSLNGILDYIPTKDDVLNYLCNHVEEDCVVNREILDNVLSKMDDEMLSRIYYTNQVKELVFRNSYFIDLLRKIVFDEDENAQKEFKEKIMEVCFYKALYEDRYRRALKNTRRSVVVVDTDSNFININEYVCKSSELLGIADGDPKQISIMNAYIDVVTKALEGTFYIFTTNMGLIERAKPIINMKSEFIYRRILLTKNKKNYSGIIIAELGKMLDKPQMDTKGLAAIKKTNVPKKLRKQFAEILRGDILEADKISITKILNKYDEIGKNISDSLKQGNTEYLLPKNAEIIETYAEPDQIESIRGTLVWNALEPESTIVLPEKVNLIKLKALDPDSPEFETLKATHPDKYAAIMKVVFNEGVTNPKLDISRFKFTAVAIPKSVEKIPEYLIPFIDYRAMVNNNIANGYVILESLGIYVSQVDKFQYKSNIIRL